MDKLQPREPQFYVEKQQKDNDEGWTFCARYTSEVLFCALKFQQGVLLLETFLFT